MTNKEPPKPVPPIPTSEQNSPLNPNFYAEPLETWPRREEYNLIQIARETKQKIDKRIGGQNNERKKRTN